MNKVSPPQEWLLAEFERMKARNSRLTLRALARRLELSPGRLSELLSGKRPITKKAAEKIADRLALDPSRKQHFVTSARNITRNEAGSARAKTTPDYQMLVLDQFSVIADWYHYAILSLMELKSFEPSTNWIAKRLGISTLQAKSAVQRLRRVGLIEIKGETWISTGQHLQTPTDIASSALRRSHRQDLRRAIDALNDVPLHARDITAMTMAIDTKKLPEAKKRIQNFRKELAAFLEGGDADEVYNLNIQVIPISKKQTEGEGK